MILYGSLASPFVRKVRVLLHEAHLTEQVRFEAVSLSPVTPDATVSEKNPLGKIPVLELPDSSLLYDSRVISEYLDATFNHHRFLPAQGPQRWLILRQQALADGILDAGVLIRYETYLRPEPLRWSDWLVGQCCKITTALDQLEQDALGFGTEPDLGLIAVACTVGWLHFRRPLAYHPAESIDIAKSWPHLQAWYETFNQRPAMQTTLPVA